MIDRMPREGYGFGIIRMTDRLVCASTSFFAIQLVSMTDMQGELRNQGIFDQFKQGLYLPDDHIIHGIFVEPPRMTWCVLVEAPGIPTPDEGEALPVLKPIYTQTWDFEKGTYHAQLKRIEVSSDPHYALRVD